MLNSVNKKLLGIIGLLLVCSCVLGVVALWGISRQGNLLSDVETNAQGVFDKVGGLNTQLDETINNGTRMGEMAAQLGEEFKSVQTLMKNADEDAAKTRKSNVASLAATALQLLDLRLNTAKFLADACVKSSDVRDSADGFYRASMEDFGFEVEVDESTDELSDPYDDQGIVNDFVGAFVSSANADFYVFLGLDGPLEGKGLFSNESDLFELDLSTSYLYETAIKENRISKSIDLVGDDLVLASAAFMKNTAGNNVGLLLAGFRLNVATLRFLAADLNAYLTLFIADEKGKIGKAKYSTLVDSKGALLTYVTAPKAVVSDFSKRLKKLAKTAKAKNAAIDGRSIRSDFIDIREEEMGQIDYTTAYQALLTDSGELLGVLAVSRNSSQAVAAQNKIATKTDLAVANVEKVDQTREEIAEANAQGKIEANNLVAATDEVKVQLQGSLKTASAVAKKAKIATSLALVVSLCIGLFAAVLIKRTVVKPIQLAVKLAEQIRKGDMSSRLDVTQKDELGQLASALNSMAEGLQEKAAVMSDIAQGNFSHEVTLSSDEDVVGHALQRILKEVGTVMSTINGLVQEAVAGNLDERANTDLLNGEFKNMIGGVNSLVDAFMQPIQEALRVIQAQSQGEFVLIEQEFVGDYEVIRQHVNNVSMTLQSIQGQFEELDHAVRAGNLSFRCPTEEYKGAYHDIVEVVNHTLDGLIGPLNTTADYIEKISRGEMPSPIVEEYKGDFNVIKRNVNSLLDEVNAMMEGTQKLAAAALQGDLDYRADTNLHKGAYREIIESMNSTLHAVAAPLAETAEVLGAASSRNLSLRVTADYQGSLAALKNDINLTLNNLCEAMREVTDAVERVNSNSHQIDGASQSLSQGAMQQAAALEEIGSSMTEIASQTKTNAENATQASSLAKSARDNAETGSQQMQDMVSAMNGINDSSQQIAKIIKVIDDIAFQTNLLALNAAVEAARAGQHGKGFAVVADEVRNLAGRSAKAAKETAELIESSNSKVEKGLSIAAVTAESLAGIVDGIVKVTSLAGEIATASNEQAQGVAQINLGLNQVDSVAQQNTASAEETASAASLLSAQATSLHDMVSLFKLDQHAQENADQPNEYLALPEG